jgi:hypothetical protein
MGKKRMEREETLEDVKQADLGEKKEILQEAVRVASAHGNAEELLRDLVRNVSLDAKQAVVAGAVASDNNAGAILSEALKQAPPLSMKTVVREAVENSDNQRAARDLITEAINAAPPDATKDAVAKAVKNADDSQEAQEILTQAINAAPAGTAEAAIKDARVLPTPGTLDKIWMIVVRTFAAVLVGAMVALVVIVILDVAYEVELAHVQIMLTMFTTVAGILAGFITGQAVGTAQERDKERG